MRAQRKLGESTDLLTGITERLGSGLRINSASDDPAGLAISTGLRSETRIYTQAIRNLNDGASLLNVAEGALNELSELMTRQKEQQMGSTRLNNERQ